MSAPRLTLPSPSGSVRSRGTGYGGPSDWFPLLGVSMEYLQRMTGYRTFEYGDMAANTVGVLCALLAAQTPLARGLAVMREKPLLRLVR